jgi:hypothetical protein
MKTIDPYSGANVKKVFLKGRLVVELKIGRQFFRPKDKTLLQ